MGTLYYGDNFDSRHSNIWFRQLASYILNGPHNSVRTVILETLCLMIF